LSGTEGRRLRLLLLVAGTLAIAALHLWIARDVTAARRGPGDQWGYIGSARFLAGDSHPYVLPSFPYFSYGYSIVLAPLVRVYRDPGELFTAIKVVNALLMASVLPLAYAFSRVVLMASRSRAAVAALVAALVPPCLAHPSGILAENLVLPLTMATVLACWLFLTERPTWQRLLFGPAMVWLHVSHNRFAIALPVFFVILLVAWLSRLVTPRVTMANATLAVGLLVLAQILRDRIVAARWVDGIETPQGPASDVLDLLQDRSLLQAYLLEAVGQAWYLVVGTLGIAALGLWSVLVLLRSRQEGPLPRGFRDPVCLTLGFLMASALGVFMTSTYFFTRVENGSEGFIAGRHNESFVPMWVAAGVLVLLQANERRSRTLRPLVGAMVGIVALSGVLLVGRNAADWRGDYSSLNVPAMVHYAPLDERLVPVAALLAVGTLALAALCTATRRPAALVLPLAAGWLVWSVGSEVDHDRYHETWAMPSLIGELDIDRAAVVQQRNDGVPPYYLFFLPSLRATPWSGIGAPPERVVLARADQPGLAELGGRLAAVDYPIERFGPGWYGVGLWVLPGPEQTELDRSGALLPVGFPAALSPESMARDLRAVDGAPDGVVQVKRGDAVSVTVRVRHTGTGSPWPDEASVGPTGSVRISARPNDHPPGGIRPASGSAAMPRWMRPGDEVLVVLELRAVDSIGRDLPRGRYGMAVDLEQVGFEWFAAPGSEQLRLVLDVR